MKNSDDLHDAKINITSSGSRFIIDASSPDTIAAMELDRQQLVTLYSLIRSVLENNNTVRIGDSHTDWTEP